MPRVLVLGGNGMLGHKLCQVFSSRFETWATLRGDPPPAGVGVLDQVRTIASTDLCNDEMLRRAMDTARPDVVVNAAGVVKQRPEARDPIPTIATNALLPHRIAAHCDRAGARLVQVSTDCVFSGRRGMYREDDVADCDDLYGRSKLLGEVTAGRALTLRTSIIGRELGTRQGLVEWLLASAGTRVSGYAGAIWSGLPTIVLARLVADVVERHPSLGGLYHVGGRPVTKHALLCLVRDAYGVEVEIDEVDEPRLDRSLDSARFCAATGYVAPAWPALVADLVADPSPYEHWRRALAA